MKKINLIFFWMLLWSIAGYGQTALDAPLPSKFDGLKANLLVNLILLDCTMHKKSIKKPFNEVKMY